MKKSNLIFFIPFAFIICLIGIFIFDINVKLKSSDKDFKLNSVLIGSEGPDIDLGQLEAGHTVEFDLNQGEFSLPVSHFSAAIPDLFGDSAEVIIEGKYENKVLVADNLMTKCASKYEEERDYTSYSDK